MLLLGLLGNGEYGEIMEIREQKAGHEREAGRLYPDRQEQIGVSFFTAWKEAMDNVFSTFGPASIAPKENDNRAGLQAMLQKTFTPLSAYSFIAFVLLYMPCVVVAVAMRHEFGTWKWFAIAFVCQMTLAWVVAVLVYQGGRLLGIG